MKKINLILELFEVDIKNGKNRLDIEVDILNKN